jgi:hypothetical protein
MKISCPRCNAQILIFSIAVICTCGASVFSIDKRHDDLPHNDFSTQMMKIDSVISSGTASSATTTMVHASDIGKS